MEEGTDAAKIRSQHGERKRGVRTEINMITAVKMRPTGRDELRVLKDNFPAAISGYNKLWPYYL